MVWKSIARLYVGISFVYFHITVGIDLSAKLKNILFLMFQEGENIVNSWGHNCIFSWSPDSIRRWNPLVTVLHGPYRFVGTIGCKQVICLQNIKRNQFSYFPKPLAIQYVRFHFSLKSGMLENNLLDDWILNCHILLQVTNHVYFWHL